LEAKLMLVTEAASELPNNLTIFLSSSLVKLTLCLPHTFSRDLRST
jgi:hypothetical protein